MGNLLEGGLGRGPPEGPPFVRSVHLLGTRGRMQGLCHDQSDGQGVQSKMVLSIGSTPLIKMSFRVQRRSTSGRLR